jgi:hypothetical protein
MARPVRQGDSRPDPARFADSDGAYCQPVRHAWAAGRARGTIRSLRVFAYHFGYVGKAGLDLVGVNSGWDVKRVLGTAKLEADGSAPFQIPANTPVYPSSR